MCPVSLSIVFGQVRPYADSNIKRSELGAVASVGRVVNIFPLTSICLRDISNHISQACSNIFGSDINDSHIMTLSSKMTELPYDPAIPLLGIHTEETRIERDTCTEYF